MSLPTDPRSTLPPGPRADPHSDRLVASAVRAAAGAPAADCPDAELLALYAERALGASDLALVEPHVDSCPRCQAIVSACVRALPDLSEASPVDAGALDAGASGASWFAGWRWLVPITSVAAVAMVAVWIGRGPADQVAQQTSFEGVARDEPVSEFSRPAAPAPPAPASADTAAARKALAGAEREADAGGLATARANGAVATSPTAQQERRLLRREDAQEKAAAAEAVPDAPPLANAPAALAEELPREQAATRQLASSLLTGTVTYRARVALPAGAVIEVRLLDLARADPSASFRAGAPADTLARAEIVTRGEQVPVAFSLPYDPNAIEAGRRYVVQATIAVGGTIAWRTTTQHPVFVDGAALPSPVTIVVDQIR